MVQRLLAVCAVLGAASLLLASAYACAPNAKCSSNAMDGPSAGGPATRNVTANQTTPRGGVRVAVGDLNGDGVTNGNSSGPGVILAPAQKPQSALLLPAVQKVREAAKR